MRKKDREITNKDEIKEIFEKADACRIGFAVDNIPYIICLNYGYEWLNENPALYFHCANEGKKLDQIRQNNLVCLQLDIEHEYYCNEEINYCTGYYSSIIGWGHLEIVTNEQERKHGLDLLMIHHGHQAPENYPEESLARTTILRLGITELTAKRNKKKEM